MSFASQDDVLAALAALNIPAHPHSLLPGLSVSPAGVPYIRLPAPHDALCLTPTCPDGWRTAAPKAQELRSGYTYDQNDIDAVLRLLGQPTSQMGMMGVLGGPQIPRPMVEKMMYEAHKSRDSLRLSTVRPLASFLDWPNSPLELVAVTQLNKYDFRRQPEPSKTEWIEREKDMGGRDFHWAWRVVVDEAWLGKGIGKTVATYFINEYFAKHFYTYPGQLISSYYQSNLASAALHRSLGFLDVAISAERPKDGLPSSKAMAEVKEALSAGGQGGDASAQAGVDSNGGSVSAGAPVASKAPTEGLSLLCSVWMGPDRKDVLAKEDTIFKDLPSCEG